MSATLLLFSSLLLSFSSCLFSPDVPPSPGPTRALTKTDVPQENIEMPGGVKGGGERKRTMTMTDHANEGDEASVCTVHGGGVDCHVRLEEVEQNPGNVGPGLRSSTMSPSTHVFFNFHFSSMISGRR